MTASFRLKFELNWSGTVHMRRTAFKWVHMH